MAIQWGSYDNHMRVGIDLSVSGTKITAKYYVGTDYSGGISDDQVLTLTGAVTGSVSFHNSSREGDPQLVATRTKTGSRGSTYTFGAKLSGAYNGATPSESDSIKVPATVPSKMSKPSISSITSSSATVSWSKPAGNGATVTGAQIQVDNSSSFSSPAEDYFDSASPSYPNGLVGNTTYYVRMRAKNSEGYGAWSDTVSFKTKVEKPLAPTIGTPTVNSDTSITVRWSRNVTTEKPYTSQQVFRRYYTSSGWTSWSRIATVSSTATSYAWSGANAGHVYQFLVKALNAAGDTNSSSSVNAYTTPDAPSSVKATKNSAGNIVLTWAMDPNSGSVGSSVGFDIQESAGGGTWTTRASGVEALTWTHSAPNASVTHQYRVRMRIIASGLPGSGKASDYVSSNTVQLLAPPNAPTGLAYTPAGVVDRSLPVELSWVHNPVDSSDQTKFQVRHRAVGDATWTTVPVVNSGNSVWTLPEDTYLEATQVEWQVMTWGLHATGSPWSASNTISMSTRPSVTLVSPEADEVITTATLSPVWSFDDAEGEEQVGWEIQLTDLGANQIVGSKVGADNADTATFDARVKDGGSYEVAVRVKDQSGLWSPWDTHNITVEYALPPTPVIDAIVWDGLTGSADVQFHAPDPEGAEIAVDHFEVWRRIDDGEWVLLTDELPSDAIDYVDYTPTTSGRNTYLVVAISAIPSESQSELTFTSRTNYALNARPAGAATGDGITGFGRYGPGGSETGVTMTTDAPLDTAVVRTNLVTDPRATNAARWIAAAGTGGAVSETMVTGASDGPTLPDGTKVTTYARYTWTTANTGGTPYAGPVNTGVNLPTAYPLGTLVDASIFVRASAAHTATVSIGTRLDDTTSGGGARPTPDIALPAGQWVNLSALIASDAAFDFAVPRATFWDQIMALGETVDVTAAMAVPGVAQQGPYFDGATLPRDASGDRRYVSAWSGTANDSPSTQALTLTPGAVTPNLTRFARRVVTTAKVSGSTGWQGRTSPYYAPVSGVAGEKVAVSMLQRYVGVDPLKQTRLRMEFFNSAGASIGISDGAITDLLNEQWVPVTHVAAAPGDFSFVGWWTYQLSGPPSTQIVEAGGIVDAGDILIEKADSVQPWFDGGSEAHGGVTYVYLGEEYNSASVELSPLTATYVETPQPGDTPALFINPSGDPSIAARMWRNVELTSSPSREKVLNRFAGRVLPVESTGLAEESSWSVKGTLRPWWGREPDPEGMELLWERAGLTRGPHLLRCPTPDLYEWVSIDGLSIARDAGGAEYTVTFTATKVSAP